MTVLAYIGIATVCAIGSALVAWAMSGLLVWLFPYQP